MDCHPFKMTVVTNTHLEHPPKRTADFRTEAILDFLPFL